MQVQTNSEQEAPFSGGSASIATGEESLRWACSLHDECGGLLSALQFKLETLKHYFPQQALQFQTQADQMATLLAQLGDHLRGLFRWLSPATPEPFSLVRALDGFQHDYSRRGPNLEIDFQAEGFSEPLPPDLELALFRFCRDVLDHTVRQAATKRIEIRLERDDRWAVLSVKGDDGGSHSEEGGGERGPKPPGRSGAGEPPSRPGDSDALTASPPAGVRARVRLT